MSALERDLRGLYVRLITRGALPVTAILVLAAMHDLMLPPPVRAVGSRVSRIDAVEAYLQKSVPPQLIALAQQQPDPYADDLLRELYGRGFFDLVRQPGLEDYAAGAFSSILPILQRAAGLKGASHDEAIAAISAPHVLIACGDMRKLAWSSSTNAFVGTTVTGQSAILHLAQAALYASDYQSAHSDLMAAMQYDRARTQAFAELTSLFEQHAEPPWKLSIEARRGVLAVTHPEHDTAWCTLDRLWADLGQPDAPSLQLPRPRRSYMPAHPVSDWIDQACRRLTSGELWFLRYESRAGQWSLARTGDPGVRPFY